ncbi:MAG: hypothetical protein ACMXYG_06035 [Candidatus Woesearchaeota archaeon]
MNGLDETRTGIRDIGLDRRLDYREQLRPLREQLDYQVNQLDPNHPLRRHLDGYTGQERQDRLDQIIQDNIARQQMPKYSREQLEPVREAIHNDIMNQDVNNPDRRAFEQLNPQQREETLDMLANRLLHQQERQNISRNPLEMSTPSYAAQRPAEYDENTSTRNLMQEDDRTRKVRIGQQVLSDIIEKHENEKRKYIKLNGDTSNAPELDLADELGYLKPIGMSKNDFKNELNSRQGESKLEYLGDNYLSLMERQENSRSARLTTGEKVKDMTTDELLDKFFSYMSDQRAYDTLARDYQKAMYKIHSNIDDFIGEGAPSRFEIGKRKSIVTSIIDYFTSKSGLDRDNYFAEIGISDTYDEVLEKIVSEERNLNPMDRDNQLLNHMLTYEVDNSHIFGDVKKIYGELTRSKTHKDRVIQRISDKLGKPLKPEITAGEALGKYLEKIRIDEPEIDKTFY